MTVDGVTQPLPDPFLLIATENAIEQEGTFPLPEAQLDRFIVRTLARLPLARGRALDRRRAAPRSPRRLAPAGRRPLRAPVVFRAHEEVYIDPLLKQWAVELVRATRSLDIVEVGASVRGSLALERMARALALVLGREYVVAEDIERLFPLVVMHRMVLATDIVMEGLSGGELVERVWQACVERPRGRSPPGTPPSDRRRMT